MGYSSSCAAPGWSVLVTLRQQACRGATYRNWRTGVSWSVSDAAFTPCRVLHLASTVRWLKSPSGPPEERSACSQRFASTD